MQEIIHVQDIVVIKWLIGCVGFLVVLVNAVLGYWFREIYRMVKDDHEMLKAMHTEHKIFHKDDTGLS